MAGLGSAASFKAVQYSDGDTHWRSHPKCAREQPGGGRVRVVSFDKQERHDSKRLSVALQERPASKRDM